MSVEVIKEYQAHLDQKNRLTLRGAWCEYYDVKMFEDGHVLLEPRVLVDPTTLSKNTLKMLDQSMKNLKLGKVSDPINLDRYL